MWVGVLIGLHVITCGLLFVYLRRRAPVVYAVLAHDEEHRASLLLPRRSDDVDGDAGPA